MAGKLPQRKTQRGTGNSSIFQVKLLCKTSFSGDVHAALRVISLSRSLTHSFVAAEAALNSCSEGRRWCSTWHQLKKKSKKPPQASGGYDGESLIWGWSRGEWVRRNPKASRLILEEGSMVVAGRFTPTCGTANSRVTWWHQTAGKSRESANGYRWWENKPLPPCPCFFCPSTHAEVPKQASRDFKHGG